MPIGQPLPSQGPSVAFQVADERRERRESQAQMDRRLGRRGEQKAPCVVSPDEPVVDIGWFWFDESSTAENP